MKEGRTRLHQLYLSGWGQLKKIGFGVADQAFSVGGMFIANVALARAVTKEEYGIFALAYSVLNFVTGMHNAAILEPYTVHGAGRYNKQYLEYRWLIWRSNAFLGLLLTAVLLVAWWAMSWTLRPLASRSLLGLALSTAIILTASLLRRMLYVQKETGLAAKSSFVFFVALAVSLAALMKAALLNSLTVFLALAVCSIIGSVVIFHRVPRWVSIKSFVASQPTYWSDHWKYARWVVVTALVFLLTTQAYYWLVAAFVSLSDVAELRAIYMLVMPVDQVFTAISLIVLPIMATRYAAGQISELLSLWRVYLLAFVAIGAVFVFAVLLLGKPLMNWIYGGKFDDAAPLLGVLALLPVVMGIGHTMNAAMKAAERPNMVFFAYLASGSATFLIGIPLMIHFGLRGAVYGMLISGAVYTGALAIGFFSLMPRLQGLLVVNERNASY